MVHGRNKGQKDHHNYKYYPIGGHAVATQSWLLRFHNVGDTHRWPHHHAYNAYFGPPMKGKRIALIHPRLILRGGLESRLLNYMQWFSNKGCNVTVFCFKHDESISLPKNVHVHKFNMRWVPKPYRHRYFSYLLERQSVKEKFDLAFSLGRTGHQHVVLAPGNHIGYLKAFGRSPKTVSDREQIAMDRKAYATSEFILAASKLMADELPEQFGTPANKIHVLYPPISKERLTGVTRNLTKTEAREQLSLDPKRKIVAAVSTGHVMKGIPFLLEVMKLVPDVQLVVAGSAVPETANVKHLGFLKEPNILYRAADATVLPSVYEAFGQVVAESLFCGTPVIVSEMVGAKEIMVNGCGTVLPVQDIEAWKTALESLTLKPETTDPLIDLEPYSVEQHMSNLCQIVGLNL